MLKTLYVISCKQIIQTLLLPLPILEKYDLGAIFGSLCMRRSLPRLPLRMKSSHAYELGIITGIVTVDSHEINGNETLCVLIVWGTVTELCRRHLQKGRYLVSENFASFWLHCLCAEETTVLAITLKKFNVYRLLCTIYK